MTLHLSSPAFAEAHAIPVQHTCQAQDLSPPLVWTGVPARTRTLALIVDDPDAPAGTWVHWVVFDLAPALKGLPAGVTKTEALSNGAIQGLNSFQNVGYNGPCPPAGSPHRYFFKLYALDTRLALKPGASKEQVLAVMKGHILAQAQAMGTYQRR